MAAPISICDHCQLSDEDSLLNQILTASLPLPKFHPNLAEIESSVDYEHELTAQHPGDPDVRKKISDLMLTYVDRDYDVQRTIMGEDMVHFAFKYRLSPEVVTTLLKNGAPGQGYDQLGFTPFRVGTLDLPNSKPSLLALLKQGIHILEEDCLHHNYEDRKRHPLRILCHRSPDDETAEIIRAYMYLEYAVPFPGQEYHHSRVFKDLTHACLHTAVDNAAPVSVIKALVENAAPTNYSPGVAYSIVGKSILAQSPQILEYLISQGTRVAARCAMENNPLFVCIQNAMESCGEDHSLEQVLNDANYKCMCILLDRGCYVNEIGCRFDSKNHIYRFWDTPEAINRGYEEPEVLTGMSAFYKCDDNGMRRRPPLLTSYIHTAQYPSVYFLLLALEKLVDAGAVPNQGELPRDIVGWLFDKYAHSQDEMIRDAVPIVVNKLLAAGFDLHQQDIFYAYVLGRLTDDPRWTIPDEEMKHMERFKDSRRQPHPLILLTVVTFREMLAFDYIERGPWGIPSPLFKKVDELKGIPPLIKDIITLRNLKSLSEHWKEEINSF